MVIIQNVYILRADWFPYHATASPASASRKFSVTAYTIKSAIKLDTLW